MSDKNLTTTYYANELANTLVGDVPSLTAQAAFTKWAEENPDITGIDALNKEANNTLPNYLAEQGVLNQLAGTDHLSSQEAAWNLANP